MIVDTSRQAAKKKLLFLPHAIRQMSRPERMITPQEVERVVMTVSLWKTIPTTVEATVTCSWVLASRGEESMSSVHPKRII